MELADDRARAYLLLESLQRFCCCTALAVGPLAHYILRENEKSDPELQCKCMMAVLFACFSSDLAGRYEAGGIT